jgi:hypothetical protein
MNLEFLERKDFWSGLLLIATGVGAIVIASNYAFGDSLRMGPGYFPSVLGGILILFGLYIGGTALRSGEKLVGSWSLRALTILPLSLILFGLLIDRAGFVPALMVLIFGSATASTQFRAIETLLFSIFLTALCVAIFIWALGMPYPLIAEF